MREAELSDASSSCRMIPKVVVAVSYCTFVAMTSVSLSKVTYASGEVIHMARVLYLPFLRVVFRESHSTGTRP